MVQQEKVELQCDFCSDFIKPDRDDLGGTMVPHEKLGVQSSLVKKGKRDEKDRIPFAFRSPASLLP
jgi:hypothetical protein